MESLENRNLSWPVFCASNAAFTKGVIASCFVVLAACSSTTVLNGGGDGGPASSSGSTSSSSGGADTLPASGVWSYSQVARASDTCNLPSVRDPSGKFQIKDGSGGTFMIVPGDGTAPFPCTVSAGTYSCPDRASQTVDLDGAGLNAVVSAHATVNGDVVSASQFNGRQNLQVTCAGADCGTVASAAGTAFPCAIAITFVADKT